MKKQSDLSRLMGYAGNYRYFTYASWVLSAVSALVALVPFVYIWKILRDVLNAAPNYAQAVNIPHYGWMAVLFAVLSYLIYIAALMCSHLSAFRVATNLRLEVSEHLATLPLGFTETFGSGKLRKIIHESTGAAETFLAHQLPDRQALAVAHGADLIGVRLQHRTGIENIHRAAPAEPLFLEDRPRGGGVGVHLADNLTGILRQQRDIDRVRRHQLDNKGFHAGAGQPVGIGERDLEEVMA